MSGGEQWGGLLKADKRYTVVSEGEVLKRHYGPADASLLREGEVLMGGDLTAEDLKRPFNKDPKLSAQPCGCDPGAHYVCTTHQQTRMSLAEVIAENGAAALLGVRPSQSAVYENIGLPSAEAPNRCTTLPTDPAERKKYPIFSGVLAYFPDAIAAVAHVSWVGNNQHNPGQPLHWARGKSTDQEDTLVRHLMESAGGNVGNGFDSDGLRHSAKAAWRALAKLQLEIEADQKEER